MTNFLALPAARKEPAMSGLVVVANLWFRRQLSCRVHELSLEQRSSSYSKN